MQPWLETANGTMSSLENMAFNLDIVEPKEFHLAEDYLSENFSNCYQYRLSCFKFLPLQQVS